MPTTIDALAAVDETVADGDLLLLHNVSKAVNSKDQKMSITKLRTDAFLAVANTWTALQTFDGGAHVQDNDRLSQYNTQRWFAHTGGAVSRTNAQTLFRIDGSAVMSGIVKVDYAEVWSGNAGNRRVFSGIFALGKNGGVTGTMARTILANSSVRINCLTSGNNFDFVLTDNSDVRIATAGSDNIWHVEVLMHTGTWTYTPAP